MVNALCNLGKIPKEFGKSFACILSRVCLWGSWINVNKVLLRIRNGQRRKNALTVKTPAEFKGMQLFQNVNIKHYTMEVALLLLQVPGGH